MSSSAGKFFWQSSEPGAQVDLSLQCIENPAAEAYFLALEAYNNYLFALEDFLFFNDPIAYPDPRPGPADPGNVEPDPDICGYASVELQGGALSTAPTSFFTDTSELLRILPANNQPTPRVNTPLSFSFFLLGLGILLFRKQG